jgi:pyruvate-formate lyase-activating enzyme
MRDKNKDQEIKIPHKFSKEHYSEKIKEIKGYLSKFSDIIKPLLGTIQQRLLVVAIENIVVSVEYYYNSRTHIIRGLVTQKFWENLKYMKKILNFISEIDENKKQQILAILTTIADLFKLQYEYIAGLEKKK